VLPFLIKNDILVREFAKILSVCDLPKGWEMDIEARDKKIPLFYEKFKEIIFKSHPTISIKADLARAVCAIDESIGDKTVYSWFKEIPNPRTGGVYYTVGQVKELHIRALVSAIPIEEDTLLEENLDTFKKLWAIEVEPIQKQFEAEKLKIEEELKIANQEKIEEEELKLKIAKQEEKEQLAKISHEEKIPDNAHQDTSIEHSEQQILKLAQKIVATKDHDNNSSIVNKQDYSDVINKLSSVTPIMHCKSISPSFYDSDILDKIIDLFDINPPKGNDNAVLIESTFGGEENDLILNLYNDKDVRKLFSDGIIWVSFFGERLGPIPWVEELIFRVTGDIVTIDSVDSASKIVSSLLLNKNYLLVLENVSEISQIVPFFIGGPNCSRIFTTENIDLKKSLQIFVNYFFLEPLSDKDGLVTISNSVEYHRTSRKYLEVLRDSFGNWPIFLEIANILLIDEIYLLDDYLPVNLTDENTKKDKKELLDIAKTYFGKIINIFRKENEFNLNKSIETCFLATFHSLSKYNKNRLIDLCIFHKHAYIPLSTICWLWRNTADQNDSYSRMQVLAFQKLRFLQPSCYSDKTTPYADCKINPLYFDHIDSLADKKIFKEIISNSSDSIPDKNTILPIFRDFD
jgi:hypothetical protein